MSAVSRSRRQAGLWNSIASVSNVDYDAGRVRSRVEYRQGQEKEECYCKEEWIRREMKFGKRDPTRNPKACVVLYWR